jgi:hypothetical protein
MTQFGGFDPTFDFRTEAGRGEDPDSTSPTLKAYHKLLWSKPLPSGDSFDLDDTTPHAYLHHLSTRGEFYLTSDSASPTWISWRKMAHIVALIPEWEGEQFRTVAHQMGDKMLFPGKQIDGKQTINQERGSTSQIADRLDLTLECIRLHYLGEASPLADALIRYWDFFALFEDFHRYTDFFLLQDLVSEDSSAVKFLIPFADFGTSPLPPTVEVYQDYRRNAIRFVEARNRRMAEYVARL